MTFVCVPELLYLDVSFEPGKALVVAADWTISSIEDAASLRDADTKVVQLPGGALLPGMVDVHSHSFQRTIRGTAASSIRVGT